MLLEKIRRGVYSPEEFLRLLNGQFCRYRFSWGFKPDHVVVGGCSQSTSQEIFRTIEESVRKSGVSTGRVLLISDCCGAYRSDLVPLLKEVLPGIVWIVPQTIDYSAQTFPARVALDLMRLNLIEGG